MRFLSPNLLSLAFAAVLAAGCASKPAGENPAERPARIIPPTMIRGPVPEFRQPEPIDAKLEVLVDVNGDPVMNTL